MFAFLGRRSEILFYLTIAVGLPLLWNSPCTPRFSDDSYQYLSTARNLVGGKGAATSIVHLDAERLQKKLPAEITSYPPGYAALLATVSAAGMTPERSAQLIGAIAFGCALFISAALCRMLQVPVTGRLLAVGVLATHAMSVRLCTFILSEMPFTALSLAALWLHAREVSRPETRWWMAILAWMAAAAAYWVRYAGLFLFAGLILFYVLWWIGGQRRRAGFTLLLALPAVAVIGVRLWQNDLLTGSWRGGNLKPVVKPVLWVTKSFISIVHQLLFGVPPGQGGWTGVAAPVLFVAAVVWLIWRWPRAQWPSPRLEAQVLLGYGAVYLAASLYSAFRVTISFDQRLFYPVLPVAVVLAAWAFAAVPPGWRTRVAIGGIAVLVVFAQLRQWPECAPPPHAAMNAAIAEPAFQEWLGKHIPPGTAVGSTRGQPFSYAVNRPAVSFTPSDLSQESWDEATVRRTMAVFGARYLFVHPAATAGDAPEQFESPFLRSLADGNPPPGIVLAIGVPGLSAYDMNPDKNGAANQIHPRTP